MPSASAILNKSRLEGLVYRSAVLCREAFERAVYAGRQYRVLLESGELRVFCLEDDQWQIVEDVWLRSLTIPAECSIGWPEEGWIVLPEGFCESPRIRFHDTQANETILVRIRPYDAYFVRESIDASDLAVR